MANSDANIPVAVIGMACRLPGANDLDQFWRLLYEGRSALGPVPAERLDRSLYYHPQRGVPGKTYTDQAGLVSYELGRHAPCPVPEGVREKFDIAHVVLCEVAAAACRHAGLDPAALPQRRAGVYIGHASASGLAAKLTYATYVAQTARYLREVVGFEQLAGGLGDAMIRELVEDIRREHPRRAADGSPYLGASVAASLIARTLGLDGPYMAFNSACASSLQALAQGVRALQLGRIDMALVGGASCFHSDTLVLFSQAQSVTAGASHPFAAGADGMVVGEGYVVLLLKTLARAVADGDRICAVISGIGLSSDGHGKSLWAPRQEGQIAAIQRAYGPQVPMSRLQYIEAHATSTHLGDLTELSALGVALAGQLPPGTKIPIGSVKLNVGHTLEAAGLVGVVKTVLCLQNHTIVPAIDDRPLNPDVDWGRLPLVVPSAPMPWPAAADGYPRRAGVDAFGIGGLNVHVVVDEFVRSKRSQGGKEGDRSMFSDQFTPTNQAQGPKNGPVPARPVNGCDHSKRVSVAVAPDVAAAAGAAPRLGGSDEEAVAIVGCGAVFPGARTLEAFWQLLLSGRDPKTTVPPDRWDADVFCCPGAAGPFQTPTSRGGFITDFHYDWRKHRIPPKQIAQASPLQFMILDAVDQAFAQAGFSSRPPDRSRIGVMVGTVFGGDFSAQLVMGLRLPDFQQRLAQLLRRHGVAEDRIAQCSAAYAEVLLKHMPALLDETGSFTASALASRITKTFDLMGGAAAVDAGTASSMAALNCSVDLLRTGSCDMMVCVGAQQNMTPLLYEAAAINGTLATGAVRSPFDAAADGCLPAEGCGVMLLKRLADARRDGDVVRGIIRGLGAGFAPARGDAVRLAIGRALADAGLAAADVALVETAGTGKAALDAEEARAIADAYAAEPRSDRVLLGSLVGQIGHAGGAAGMASLLKASLALENQQMPASGGLTQAAPFLTEGRALLQAVPTTLPLAPHAPRERLVAGVNSCGGLEVAYHILIERGATVTSSAQIPLLTKQPPAAAPSAPVPSANGNGRGNGNNKGHSTIVHFDATVRRREKMRQRAASQGVSQFSSVASAGDAVSAGDAENGTVPVPITAASANPSGCAPDDTTAIEAHGGNGAAAHAPLSETRVLRTARSDPAETMPAPAAPANACPPPLELEKFLVYFVVEQTGYPPEIVNMDADLEADLGIDSIKKAQLFAELGSYFHVAPSADLRLDDFPTLRHVSDYLSRNVGAPVTTAAKEEDTRAARPLQDGGAAAGLSHRARENAAGQASSGTQGFGADGLPDRPGDASALDAAELEKFLVNFVVEQTGYPPEIVGLDADLEADLGIDSIKKAQLFAELGDYFHVAPSADLRLDDFPTLRHVSDYLIANVRPAVPEEQPPLPPAAVPAPLPERPVEAVRLDPLELAKFLVNFVVEQTGYPPEIVGLDADLEADLGIDSIKKAQLFAELGDYFHVAPSADLRLDDFPTLRHVSDYLIKNVSGNLAGTYCPAVADA